VLPPRRSAACTDCANLWVGMNAPDPQAPPRADLAVVVVNYNAGEYLARCVTSVIEASGELALDILIVDNASSDGSARAAAERSPRARLIENPTNRGLSAAWNQGARAVDAPWVLFLNPDAEIWKGDLEAFVKAGEGRMSRPPWNFGDGPCGFQATS